MKELQIIKEFQSLIPPLTKEEFDLLEQNILKEGIREPIIVYGDTIVDGHNRYKIAQKHDLVYDIIDKGFDSMDKAITWIIKNQLGRRNLNKSQKALLGAQMEKTTRGGNRKSKDQSASLHFDRKSISKTLNVSPRSINDAKKILKHGDNGLIESVKQGKLSVSAANNKISNVKKAKKHLMVPVSSEIESAIKMYMEKVNISNKNKAVEDLISIGIYNFLKERNDI